jgi:quercetin dioxygenase-like cupin family protein
VSDGWQSIRLDDIEPIAVAGGLLWRPLRRTLGVEAFGINAYVAPKAGDHVVEGHTEQNLGHEEAYVVLTGRATFTLDDESFDAPAGTIVFVRDPKVRRGARAEEPGTAVLAVGGKPGEAYSPSPWEWYFYAERFRPTEDWDGAIAFLAEGAEKYPDHSGMLYALGCFEALGGRHDDAVAHVARAVELEPGFRDWAQKDEDLAAIRGLPGFPHTS